VAASYYDLQKFRTSSNPEGASRWDWNSASFTLLLNNLFTGYWYDLRDKHLDNGIGTLGPPGQKTSLVLGSLRNSIIEITLEDVLKFRWLQYIANYLAGKTFASVGYLSVRSVPEHSMIFIDDSSAKGFTNRTFVVSQGVHTLKIRLPNGARECSYQIVVETEAEVESQCP
jgi:hypothetical protein